MQESILHTHYTHLIFSCNTCLLLIYDIVYLFVVPVTYCLCSLVRL